MWGGGEGGRRSYYKELISQSETEGLFSRSQLLLSPLLFLPFLETFLMKPSLLG